MDVPQSGWKMIMDTEDRPKGIHLKIYKLRLGFRSPEALKSGALRST